MTLRSALALAGRLRRWMPRRLATAGLLSLLVTAAEAATVLLLARLLTVTAVGGEAGPVAGLGAATARLPGPWSAEGSVGGLLLLFVLVSISVALLERATTLVSHRIEQGAAHRARIRLYEAVAEARWLPLARMRGADLVTALTGEADRVGAAAAMLLALGVRALLSLAYLAIAIRVAPGLTALAVFCGALLLLALRHQHAAARRSGEEVSAASEAVVSAATEHLGALKAVKSYGAEARNARLFAEVAGNAVEARLRAWRAYADARAGFGIGAVSVLGVVAYAALDLLAVPPATVLLLVFVFYRLVPRLAQLQATWQMLAHALPAWERLEARTEALEGEREALAGATARVELREGIRFEGVSFAYDAGRADALHRVTLELPARATTAVVGPSGSGKTTLADLVLGLVAPREGEIRVDGRPLEEGWLRAWREGIGYVAQDTLLFNDTILANVRWAQPGAAEEAVWEALRLAAADGFVRALPEGLATRVGDRGVRLSGGERQRIALARALLRRPTLLILDEATSALDAENERRVREAVRALHGRVTILLITHRLPSVRDADLVHVLDGGRRVESGSWETLMERPGGRFRALWESQAGRGGERSAGE